MRIKKRASFIIKLHFILVIQSIFIEQILLNPYKCLFSHIIVCVCFVDTNADHSPITFSDY